MTGPVRTSFQTPAAHIELILKEHTTPTQAMKRQGTDEALKERVH